MKKSTFYLFSILVLFTLFSSCKKEEMTQKNSELLLKNSDSTLLPPDPPTSGDGNYDVLGWGYDITKDYANPNSVGFPIIDIDLLKASQPLRVVKSDINTGAYKEEYGENARIYSSKITSTLTATTAVFGDFLASTFSSSVTINNKFDAKYVYGSYNLVVGYRNLKINYDVTSLQSYLSTPFLEDISNPQITPQQLVQKYGTHVMTDIITGGKLDLLFQSETVNTNREAAARIGIKAGVKDVVGLDISNSVDLANSTKNYSKKLYYRTRGGNPSLGLVGTINLDQTPSTLNIAPWQNSITTQNSILVDFNVSGLIYMYEFIADPVRKQQVKNYIDQYLIDRQVSLDYLPNPVYRSYNINIKDHYYSLANTAPSGYNLEGIEFNAFSYPAPNTVGIYSYWNGTDHFYSKSSSAPGGYTYEGIVFYAYPNASFNTVPIYRFWSNKDTDHFYSKSSQTPYNYVYEGIEFYGL